MLETLKIKHNQNMLSTLVVLLSITLYHNNLAIGLNSARKSSLKLAATWSLQPNTFKCGDPTKIVKLFENACNCYLKRYSFSSRSVTATSSQFATFFDDFEAVKGDSFSPSLPPLDALINDSCGAKKGRIGVELPLFDVLPNDDKFQSSSDPENLIIQPLPSNHLPTELATLGTYGMQLTRPVHKMIVNHSPSETIGSLFSNTGTTGCIMQQFGHVAYKPDSGSYIGAIGCAASVLLTANPEDLIGVPEGVLSTSDSQFASDAKEQISTILCRGSFRFIVREVKQTVPYTVAIVDELVDDVLPLEYDNQPDHRLSYTVNNNNVADDINETDGEEDTANAYATLARSELLPRLLQGMKTFVDLRLEKFIKEKQSPLEQALIQDVSSVNQMVFAQKEATEEMAVVFDAFVNGALVDDIMTPQSRYYAAAFMAAEMADFSNTLRRKLLGTTDSVSRLRMVLKELESIVGTMYATKAAESIIQTTNAATAELQVGVPSLPPWAKQIRKGIVIEYFWNEEFGWCACTVIDHPVLIAKDELAVTIQFDDDDTVHLLPFLADEKARWRPKQ